MSRKRRRCNPRQERVYSSFYGEGYEGTHVSVGGRQYVYVTSYLSKPDLQRFVSTPLTRLGKIGETRRGDPIWSYAGRVVPKAKKNPVQHIDHAAYQAKVRKMTDAQLHYAIKDANEALQAMPNADKAGYYADEINYCASELARRRKGGQRETNPRHHCRSRRNPSHPYQVVAYFINRNTGDQRDRQLEAGTFDECKKSAAQWAKKYPWWEVRVEKNDREPEASRHEFPPYT